MASCRKLNILLISALLLSVFSGGYHHCCDYYSETCSICSQADYQPISLSTQAKAAENIQLPFISVLSISAEFFPDPISWFTPLRGRAPPRDRDKAFSGAVEKHLDRESCVLQRWKSHGSSSVPEITSVSVRGDDPPVCPDRPQTGHAVPDAFTNPDESLRMSAIFPRR